MFNGADYLILAVVAVSALIGLWRGLVKEVFSLLTWVLAVAFAYLFYRQLGGILPIGEVTATWIRDAIGAVLIFVGVLIAGGFIRSTMNSLVKVTGLSGTDRVLGLVFGVARASLIVLVLLLFLPTLTPIAEQNWWVNSQLIPKFLEFEEWALDVHQDLSAWLKNLLGSNS